MGIIRLDVPQSVERERQVNAVRGSLSPDKRYQLDRKGYRRVYQDSLLNDAQQKRDACSRKDAGRDQTNSQQQMGIPLKCEVIVSRLRKLNPSLWFELSHADASKMGVYVRNDALPEKRMYLFAFESGVSPEFTIKKVDKDGECIGLTKGYRDVLSQLIRKRLISESKAVVLFGCPSKDSEFWNFRVNL